MANIQLYTGESAGYYSSEQVTELSKPLDPRLVSTRKGGSSALLKYIEGHDAIDNANRIFGYGNWGYKPLTLEQVVLYDPLTGEAVGIEYKAMVELMVRGAIVPIVDVGSQPVATWNVEDQIMGRRVNDAKYNKKPVDESPFTPLEKKNARAVIVEAHEQAKKGAVTDALKRALRAFGNQFGNGLYGDGHVDLSVSEEKTVEANKPAQQPRQIAQPKPQATVIDAAKPQQQKASEEPTIGQIIALCDTVYGPGKWGAVKARIFDPEKYGDIPDELMSADQRARAYGLLVTRQKAKANADAAASVAASK